MIIVSIMIESYIQQLKANGKSARTIELYAYVLNRLNKFKPLEKITKTDMIEFFSKFEGTDQTKRLFQGIIKKFYTQNNKEEIVKWIQLVNPKIITSDKNTLIIEDINALIEATDSVYWKAYIAVIFETGGRFKELQNLVWSDYRDGIIEINATKTHTMAGINRRIPLIMSGGYLDNLQLSVMALKDEQIFPYSEEWTLQKLQKIAKSAGIVKPCNPHKFRHARATDLVRRGTQEAIIRRILGWTPNSTMIARYQHFNDNSIIDAMKGTTTEKEVPKITASETSTQVENLRIQIHQNEEDIQQLLQEIENMKKFQAEFFKNVKAKYVQM